MRPFAKYKNTRVEHHGRSFASKFEAYIYDLLFLQERAGDIKDLKCQVQVHLTRARIIYKPDFKYFDVKQGKEIHCEAKGFPTPEWILKKKLWEYYGPTPLQIYYGSTNKITKSELITVKE